MRPSSLRVALVGCGQIADAHLQELKHVACANVVAVCDNQQDLARQAAARFGVPEEFNDLAEMLTAVRPDVLHITTPPHTHAALACLALKSGCHVYIEKPLSATVGECDQILEAARRYDRRVCVGHDQLLDPTWLQCRKMIGSEKFGRIVHVESIQGYDLGGSFGRAFAQDPTHWLHRLPGGLFQNVMSHMLYRVTDAIPADLTIAHAHWYSGQSPGGFPTEMRVLLKSEAATASLLFTSSARPVQRITRIYGTHQSIEVDLDSQMIRQFTNQRLPGALGKIDLPWNLARQAMSSFGRNVLRFLRSDLQFFGGMRSLFEQFYQSILDDGEPPISLAETRRVTVLMDGIFKACLADAASDYRPLDEVPSPGALGQLVTAEHTP